MVYVKEKKAGFVISIPSVVRLAGQRKDPFPNSGPGSSPTWAGRDDETSTQTTVKTGRKKGKL